METVLEAIRTVLGSPEFYHNSSSGYNYTWDYGLMLEYMFAGIILCICVSWVFRIVSKLFG